ncbi:MAG: TolC family protein [Verrucomicrobiota bacterium]|jgi:outer membrane protein TolC
MKPVRLNRWLIFILVGSVTGCVRYQPQPLLPDRMEQDFRARSLSDDGLRQFVAIILTHPPPAWPPKEFDLKSLTLAALYFHPDLAMARARVAGAQAAEITAGARPNPTASLLPTWVANPFAGESTYLFGASFDVPIETAGKRQRRIEQARQSTRAARLAFSEAAWSVRSRLRAALVEYFCAQRALELAGAEAGVREQLTNLLSQRLQAGEASRFELTVAETDSLNARIALRAAQSRQADARLALAAALGLPVAALRDVPLAWPDFDKPKGDVSLDAVQGAGPASRLDVQRALAQYAAVDAALRLEIAKQYPDVHLDPGYEYDQGEHKFSIGPSLSLPIFDRNQGPIAEAKAKRDEAAAGFLALQAGAIQQMEKAIADYQLALAQWSEASQAADNLRRRVEQSVAQQVRLGEADRLTLYYTQLQGFAALRARLDSLRQVQDALGALEDAIQRPLFDESDWQFIIRKGTL